jgi:hypothetical protein
MTSLSPAMEGRRCQRKESAMPAGAARRAHNVIDLAEWRAARHPEPVPGEVLAELDAAARVYEALLAQGHELRFDLPETETETGTGRVRAELRAIDGAVVRDVTLGEVVGFEGPSAA